MRQSNRLWFLIVLALCLVAVQKLQAQDVVPVRSKPDEHSVPVYSSREMKELMRFIPLEEVKMQAE